MGTEDFVHLIPLVGLVLVELSFYFRRMIGATPRERPAPPGRKGNGKTTPTHATESGSKARTMTQDATSAISNDDAPRERASGAYRCVRALPWRKSQEGMLERRHGPLMRLLQSGIPNATRTGSSLARRLLTFGPLP